METNNEIKFFELTENYMERTAETFSKIAGKKLQAYEGMNVENGATIRFYCDYATALVLRDTYKGRVEIEKSLDCWLVVFTLVGFKYAWGKK